MKVVLTLFKYSCECASSYKAPVLSPVAYSEFLLRSRGRGAEAYLDAERDAVFREVGDLAKANPALSGLKATMLAEIQRKIFGVSCDADVDGSEFEIGLPARCPFCGALSPVYWEATEPPEFIEKELRPVTHSEWNSLSETQKFVVVDQAIRALLT